MRINMSSALVPISLIEIINEETALFNMGNVKVIMCRHDIADRIVTLQNEGWPKEYLTEEYKALDQLRNYNLWPEGDQAIIPE